VRDVVHDHGEAGGPRGLYSVSGVKFTTARRVAEKTLRRIFAREGRALPEPDREGPPAAAAPLAALAFLRLLDDDPQAAHAEVRRIVEQESVVRAEDLLLRRTDWGILPAGARAIEPRILPVLEAHRAT
jgi:glycerol-3-phosphate dehydrogenase